MRTLTLSIALPLAVLFAAAARARQPAPSPGAPAVAIITGAHILAPAGDRWIDGSAILIEGERIKAVAPVQTLAAPAGARRIDASGLYITPGLIDLHTHLLLRPYDQMTWNDQVLKESPELRTIRATVSARETLEAGFTSIRELGTEGAGWADIALRDASASGLIAGPRIWAATLAIVASSSYGPAGFEPRVRVPQGAQEVSGADAMRKAVREQIAAGADWIKVYADYRRAPGAPATATLSDEELRAAVDEARGAGRPVSAHATTDEGVRRAVLAGVATIEHGYGATRETMQLMKDSAVVLCPTMAAAEAVARYAGWGRRDREGVLHDGVPPGVAQSRASLQLALEVGVTIACGSDAGVFAHGTNAFELELMVGAGMSPGAALRSATSVAAKVLGRERDLGTIDAGFLADLAAFPTDPLADVAALRHASLVIQAGRVVADHRAEHP